MIETLGQAVDIWLRRGRGFSSPARPDDRGLAPAVVITGGSKGLGASLSVVFAQAGHTVVLIARDAAALDAQATVIRATATRPVVTLALDITGAQAATTISKALTAHGLYVDVLINNAGVGYCGAFVDQAPETLDELIKLDVSAATALMRTFLPAMVARGRGGVLNVASLAGFVPGPYQAVYYAAKAYLIALSVAVAQEVSGSGVRVCVLTPGPIETDFHATMGAQTANYRQLFLAAQARQVALSAYRGFRLAHRVIRPGVGAPVLALALWLTPWPLSAPIVGWLLRPRGTHGTSG